MQTHRHAFVRLALSLAAILLVAAVSFAGSVAQAAIVALNDPSLPASADGFNITQDTVTGLEWLDLDITLGRSFDDIVGNDGTNELAPGGDFAGFRYATRIEFGGHSNNAVIDGLAENFNLGQGTSAIGSYPDARSFLSYLGCIGSCGSYGFIQGIFVEPTDATDPGWGAVEAFPSGLYNFGSMEITYDAAQTSRPVNGSTSLSGSYLVRPIPEPTTTLLLGRGLAALAASNARRSD